jgi:AraC family transcriptional regulator, ethanolamine operon transcriptional activator
MAIMWREFDDFDAFGEAVQTADLRMACDSVERRGWRLAAYGLGDLFLQVADEGGGNLCHGANTHGGIQLFLPLSQAATHVCNCEPLDAGSLLAIPAGTDFSIQVRRRAHAWTAVALPAGALDAGKPARGGPSSGSLVLRPGAVAVGRLADLIRRIIHSPLPGLPPGPAHDAAASELSEAVHGCLGHDEPARLAAPGRPRIDRGEIIRRALAALEAESIDRPAVTKLAVAAGVTDRTLARAFRDTFGVSPLQYVLLRQLHAVHRDLRKAAGDATVSLVLARHGIWDHGRFAARYRRQFGVLPSATLPRSP